MLAPANLSKSTGQLRSFAHDRRGSVAIEFGLVIGPFFGLMFAIFGVSLYYLGETNLDQALNSASRQILTGQSRATPSGELTVGSLRTEVCARTPTLIDCKSKLAIIINKADAWSEVQTPAFKSSISCYSGVDAMATSNFKDSDNVSKGAGGQSKIVVIVACYPWELLAQLPYLKLGNVNGGKARVVQSTVAFKSEPYGIN